MELIDWRNQLLPDSRQKIVGKIMDTLKRHLPFSGQEGLLELNKIAVRFEEKTYTTAISQPDYLRRISLKMLSMETKSQNNNISNAMATNSGGNSKNTTESGSQCIQSQVHNQGQPISMQVMNSQSQSRQQLLSQGLQNNITSTAMQSSVGLSSALPSVCTQTNLVGQNSGFGDFFPTQNISGISQNSLGNSAHGLPSSMFSNAQKQMQGRQLIQQQIMPQQQSQSQNSQQQFHYQQQLHNQLMRQKMQQGNMPHTLIPSHMQQQQQQQQNMLQSNPQSLMQSSVMQSTLQNQSSSVQNSAQSVIQQHQQSVARQNQQVQQSPIVHQHQISMSQSQQQQINEQQLVGQQTNASNMQQNQLSGQQNISEMQLQRSTGQQNNVLSLQQHPQPVNSQNSFTNHSQTGSQSSISGIQQQQQQQQHLGAVLPLNSMQSNTHSEHVMSQSKVQQQTQSSTSLTQGQQSQVQQQLISQMQAQVQPLQQQLSLQQQSNLAQQDMQQRFNSGNLLQPQSMTDQQKQLLHSQRNLQDTSTSLDSTVQSGQIIGGEWQEELYQKVKAMKEMYLTELAEMYQKTSRLHQHESIAQQPKPAQMEKFKAFRSVLEFVVYFLQLPKQSLTLTHKEKLPFYEKQILSFLNTNKKKSGFNTNTMLLQPSESQMLAPQNQPPATAMNTLPLQSSNLPLQSNPNLLQQQDHLLQSQQMQHRQMQHHLIQKQFMQQRKQTQPMLLHNQQQIPQFHQITDMNDLKPRQQPGIGIKPGIFQQQSMGGQRSFPQQQSLKPGSSFPLHSAQILPPHHLSPQVDQQSLAFSKTGTPLQGSGAGSPFIVPSPSTPLAPSPIPGDSEKPHSGISSAVSNPGHASNQLTVGAPAPSLAIGTPGISASPLLAEFTAQDTTHGNIAIAAKPGLNEQPLDRIIKAVKSMSTKALTESVSDMSSVISMVDAIAGSAPGNGSRAAVGEDLVAMTRCRVQARVSAASQDSNVGAKKMRRYMDVMSLPTPSHSASVNDAFMQFCGPDGADFESTATSIAKNPKMESLMEEIHGINDRLIDTVIDIGDGEGEAGEGIVVKCSFTATALCPSLKEQYTSGKMTNIKPIFLLVPSHYPNSSPVLLLEKASAMDDETSEETEEDISAKVRARFSVSLRGLSQPMSLWKMTKAWDMCVRSAILEYAQLRGGGTFTSKYGAWESN